jgi:hypothetical protein
MSETRTIIRTETPELYGRPIQRERLSALAYAGVGPAASVFSAPFLSAPLPRKENPMRSPEDFPADIEAKALQLAYDIRDEVDFDGVTSLIAAALMERDRAATERAAKIAEDDMRVQDEGSDEYWTAERIAAAILPPSPFLTKEPPKMTDIVARLTAAKNILKAKGHDCPSVEVGCKVLGDHGDVFWANVHLGSPKNWVSKWTFDSLEDALSEIDATAASAPCMDDLVTAKQTALSKLSNEEKALLGVGMLGVA